MTTAMRITATKRVPMDSMRKTALVAGVFYLITFISIPTLALYGPVKNHRDWILSSGSHTGVLVGGFLEVIVALAGIGTAVTLYPVVKRQNEGVALGFVGARVLEAVMIFTGVVSLLSLVTLRQAGAAGTNAASLVAVGASHVAVYNWTFLLSQSLMPGINALLLGSLMYRSRLVPRVIPVMGLIGAPLLISTVIRDAARAALLLVWARRSSRRSRWPRGSSRWACGWSSRASGPAPITADSDGGQHAADLRRRRRLTAGRTAGSPPGGPGRCVYRPTVPVGR